MVMLKRRHAKVINHLMPPHRKWFYRLRYKASIIHGSLSASSERTGSFSWIEVKSSQVRHRPGQDILWEISCYLCIICSFYMHLCCPWEGQMSEFLCTGVITGVAKTTLDAMLNCFFGPQILPTGFTPENLSCD